MKLVSVTDEFDMVMKVKEEALSKVYRISAC